ncbi:MAG TPA: MBL fold metallo-hydrolase [Candidatus Saccharimonadales bacterium]|jgi:metallo-beta-lactamase family protein|nr:MBL fold metallo-hydrolase [Candidatus Saccharimonadales bacterium]
MPKLTFLGAAGTVTGSKYLVEAEGKRLLVDCGLFQGLKELRLRNWNPLPEKPATFDWCLLTHAHLDHTGYLPRLVRDGFHGPIYADAATIELCTILLADSAHLQEEDADKAERGGYSKHAKPLPLYTREDVAPVLKAMREIPRAAPFTISPQFSVKPHDAGHIVGSSSLELTITENGKRTVVLFSGDVGRYNQSILKDPEAPPACDVLLCESTYGDREHPGGLPEDALAEVVNRVAKRGGQIVIPAFAVDRTQTLLYIIRKLETTNRIPHLPVYMDSPMAISVTDIYLRHHEDHDARFTADEKNGNPLDAHNVNYMRTVDDSKKINNVKTPAIIVSASGMATGGRVLHHIARLAPDRKNAILLAGFQAEGTRGRALEEGTKTLRIHGADVPILAEVVNLRQFSAHAGQSELMRWLSAIPSAPRQTYLTHGEPEASAALKAKIEATCKWKVALPRYLQTVDLSA